MRRTMARKKQRMEEQKRKKKVHIITALSVIFVVLVLGVIFGWGLISKMFTPGNTTDEKADIPIAVGEENNEYYEAAKNYLSSMTLEDKIYQMMISSPEAVVNSLSETEEDNVSCVTKIGDRTKKALSEVPVGGIVLVGKNIIGLPEEAKAFTADIKDAAKYPLFIGAEEEGGKYATIAEVDGLVDEESGSASEAKDESEAGKIADIVGGYMAEYGFNINFAPVCDVPSSDGYSRDHAFSGNADEVSKYVSAYVSALSNHSVLPVLRGFPGEGSAESDAAKGAHIKKSVDDFKNTDILPFKSGINSGAEFVLMSHIYVDALSSMPCDFSKEAAELLRSECSFSGIIISDDLTEDVVGAEFKTEREAAEACINAGCDMLYNVANPRGVCEYLASEVNAGNLSEDAINESVLRILAVKYKYGIIK